MPLACAKVHMKRETTVFSRYTIALLASALPAVMLLCICLGSAVIPISETLQVLWRGALGQEQQAGTAWRIIINSRLPRVLCVALVGAALSLSGGAMQGLLRNPLADGSTLGVTGGASLGAVLALALGIRIPGTANGGVMLMAMLFSFLSLLLILAMAYGLDRSLSTNSIILIGVIFSMLASSIISLVISFSHEHLKSITFWTMGSLSGSNYGYAGILALALLVCGGVILRYSRELDAFAIGEENARHIGVPVKRVKLMLLIAVSVLIGVCVSIAGTIAFVGLVIPHMTRMLTGPNHGRLLPCSLLSGAIFLLLADLVARTVLSPAELSIGVVTSLVGAAAFILIFYRTRKAGKAC